jgi:alanine dehydrogenase
LTQPGKESVLHLSAEEVASLVDCKVAYDAALTAALADPGPVTGRTEIQSNGTSLRVLVGALPSLDVIGYKQFHVAGEVVRYLCHPFELSTGRPIAILDAQHVTGFRTAASSAVAVGAVFEAAHALDVAVVGSGLEARHGLEAVASAQKVRSARVYSPNPVRREAFAEEMSEVLGLPVDAADSVAAAARNVDLVYAATDSRREVVVGLDEIEDAKMLVTVGSTIPTQRETAAEVFRRADRLIVDTPDAFSASGDLIAAYPQQQPRSLSLKDALADESAVAGELVVYKSIGSAEQDLVLAAQVVSLAAGRGVGTRRSSLSAERMLSKGSA